MLLQVTYFKQYFYYVILSSVDRRQWALRPPRQQLQQIINTSINLFVTGRFQVEK